MNVELRKVKLSEIDRDPKWNYSRQGQVIDGKDMAVAIKASQGRIENEPIVWEKKHGVFLYRMVSGFNRSAGWEVIHGKDAEITVKVRPFVDEDEARIFNTAENVARNEVLKYDLCANCHYLTEKGMTLEAIGKPLKLNKGYISKLVAVWAGLCPDVKKWWRGIARIEDEVPFTMLQMWARKEEPEQKARLESYLKGTEYEDTDDGSEGGDPDGGGEDDKPEQKKRTVKEIQDAIDRLMGKKEDPEYKDEPNLLGRIAALKWVLGYNKKV